MVGRCHPSSCRCRSSGRSAAGSAGWLTCSTPPPPDRSREPGPRISRRGAAQQRRALARAMFAHFGSLLLELLKFGTYSRARMLAATEIEGEERVVAGPPAGPRRAVLHRPFRLLGDAGHRASAAHEADFGPRASARQPGAARHARGASGPPPATPSSTARAPCARCCASLPPTAAIALLIDQHLLTPTPSTWTSSSGRRPRPRRWPRSRCAPARR